MPWNSTCPIGSISVKANRTIAQQNTTYTEVTMGNSIVGTNTNTTRDHFWNVGANEDGRHRFMQSPAFTVAGIAADPVVGVGMGAVLYAKATNGQVQWFTNSVGSSGIYQVSPNLLAATFEIPTDKTYGTLTAVPDNTYGEIFMYTTNPAVDSSIFSVQTGFFKAKAGLCQAYAIPYQIQGSSSYHNALKFGNGSDASLLNIRVRLEEIPGGVAQFKDWIYIVTYRSLF